LKEFKKTAIAVGVAHVVWMASSGVAFAQTAPAAGNGETNSVVVVGQRAALESAAQIKKNADEIVDSIVADDIGKLPDRSVTEVLQRIPGVTIDRTLNRADPMQGVGDGIQHFAAEGTGVSVRGLSYVRSELNGRDSFSANGGRSLSFEDVPPELMAGVDVYKNPSAEQIEGGIGGLVNLRTAMPFDFKGFKSSVSVEASRADHRGTTKPAFSGLVSNRWDTELGQFGALLDLAHSEISTAADGIATSPYIPRSNITPGQTRWITPGGQLNSNTFDRTRDGLYAAFQWKKGDLSSGLTFFKSKYKMATEETGFNILTNPATVTVDPGATFDSHGALLTGVLTNPDDGGYGGFPTGMSFGAVERFSARKADTTDISWNGVWKASDQWVFRADLQHVRANTQGYDNTVGTGGYMPKSTVDKSTSPPTYTFDAADRAFLADPSHSYWSFAQEHRDRSIARQNTARLDAKYTFDSPVLQDLRFGVRATERDSVTQNTGNEWANITQAWSVGNSWQPYSAFAGLTDPRLAQTYTTHTFSNFFGGKLSVPTVVIPSPATVAGSYDATPPMFQALHDNALNFCNGTCPDWVKWSPSAFGGPSNTNEQHERTKAAYAQLRFGFDQLPYPVDGNVGVRVVQTNSNAVGYLIFNPPTGSGTPPGVPAIPAQSEKRSFNNEYTNVLPSLNLKMKASNELQFRFAAAKGMTRPDFYQMQAYTTLSETLHTHQVNGQTVLDSIDYTGTANGNPTLKPTTSNNLDLTAEYYFGKGSSLTLSVFNKKIKDIVIGRTSFYTLTDTAGQGHDFLTTGPVNGASGRANGAELGFQHYFDKLPGLLSGFGVSGNYTYIDSHLNMNAPASLWCTPKGTLDANLARDLSGCDTDGHVLGGVPMTGMSKNAYNLALLYDKGPWSARLAYSWRSKYLQAVNAYGSNGGDGIDQNPDSPNKGQGYSVNYALPTWGGDYGQLDMGVQYKVTDNLTLAFNASNLTNSIYKQYMQQQIGLKEHFAFYSGRSFYLQARYSF
jgi:iron complex outermembrane recepter protein